MEYTIMEKSFLSLILVMVLNSIVRARSVIGYDFFLSLDFL